jgi:galactokinase
MTSSVPSGAGPLPASENEAIEALWRAHREFAGSAAQVVVRSPGRVNLIGEHIDYHGGLVLPAAISLGTYVAASRRADGRRRLRSHSEMIDLELEGPGPTPESLTVPRWAMYPLGVIDELERHGGPFEAGFDVTYVSTLPQGMGLSSSASLLVGTALALEELFGRATDRRQLALLVQAAETSASGVRVGLMDPLAVALGEPGHALLIDCTDLTSRAVPLPLDEYALVVCDSGRPRSLRAGAYNERREESRAALDALEKATGISFVGRALTHEVLAAAVGRIPDPLHRRRLAHIVTENERVRRCADALRARDMERVRELFLQSHRSLRFDYEVSTPELDALVEIAREIHPLAAARLTGAGFGGSTVNLVPRPALRFFLREVPAKMARRFGDAPRAALEVDVVGGARRLS